MTGGMFPQRMSRMVLETILLDMAERVRVGDSLEGFIAYAIPYDDAEPDDPRILAEDVDVTARYRIGNLDGQGSMRIIGTFEPLTATSTDT